MAASPTGLSNYSGRDVSGQQNRQNDGGSISYKPLFYAQ
jgi:hypothetical protein